MELMEFESKVANGFVIVNFSAPWCSDCVRIEPVIKELSDEYNIIKINIDEHENISSHFAIRRIPTLVFFKDGKEIGERLVEPRSKVEILNAIKDIV